MRLLVVSDIHYACEAEQARRGHELRVAKNRLGRKLLQFFRDYVWLKNPLGQNYLLDKFFHECGPADFVVANGDYTCNTAFIGVSDDAACESARQCLGKLRERFGAPFRAVFGDHELGKMSLVGNYGGPRLASFERATQELHLDPFWQVACGNYVLFGVVSTLIALPVFGPEILPSEREKWNDLRSLHLEHIKSAFSKLDRNKKVILFCHDPTALPFLWREPSIREKLPQVEFTIIGHLHSPLIFWKSKILAGMPPIGFLGNSIRRFSTALNEAKCWKHFNVCLCPSLAGIELLKDGGFLSLELDPDGRKPARLQRHHMRR